MGKDRSSRLKSFFEDEVFLKELDKITTSEDDIDYDLEIIKLRKAWELSWEYHDTIANYLETGKIDYNLGDPDMRIVDFKAKELQPSSSPKDEFRIFKAAINYLDRGVYLKLPKEFNKTVLKNFIDDNFELIERALDSNYPDRITHQSPEQHPKTKAKIYILRVEKKMKEQEVASLMHCDPRRVRAVVKEYKDKISP